ncbi:hypothetical protein ANN_00834 [Periplaneta americana]|uniref:Uncharacterized protein n=1 Tax=Periplaneta americana TaxID=6978 RepID=A0ABQ8TUU9_PERAM|nr:hypothetical protein ANN_00834 [Periplaneta americana]
MVTIRRVNTIKVQFEASAPRPTPMELHVWIQQTLNINTDQVDMSQLNMQEKSLYSHGRKIWPMSSKSRNVTYASFVVIITVQSV